MSAKPVWRGRRQNMGGIIGGLETRLIVVNAYINAQGYTKQTLGTETYHLSEDRQQG